MEAEAEAVRLDAGWCRDGKASMLLFGRGPWQHWQALGKVINGPKRSPLPNLPNEAVRICLDVGAHAG